MLDEIIGSLIRYDGENSYQWIDVDILVSRRWQHIGLDYMGMCTDSSISGIINVYSNDTHTNKLRP